MTVLLALLLAAAVDGDPQIERRFPNPELNYIVMDARTRQVTASRWDDADVAVPVGSLVKPFLALAHAGPFPEFTCHGKSDRCWLAKGHGHEQFREALANSCNAYFLKLAEGVDARALELVAQTYGIAAPRTNTSTTRIGLSEGWKIAPVALLRAYVELSGRRSEARAAEVVAGLELAATQGTAAAFGRGVIAKTGTAACVAKRRHAGDGFVVVLDPAEWPRVALLVRVHGVPGAEAAKTTAQILRVIRTGR